MKKIALFITLVLAITLTNISQAEENNAIVPDKIIAVNPPASANNEPVQKKPASRLWNLQDADILSIINEVSLETGKNFVVDPRVTGKITLISSKPIKPKEVYDVFLSVLSLLGYSAIPNGNVIKIVPNMESPEYATRVATQASPGKGDEVVVRVIPLENISANQLIPILRPMLPQWSNISAYTPGNVLILVGRAANLERIVQVINSVDKTADNNIEIVPLRRASASQLANVLNNLQNATKATGEAVPVSIAPDERSNSILLSGNKSARLKMKLLIAQLDNPCAGTQGNTEVIYLRYLQAKNFAPILGKIAQNMMGKDTKDVSVTTTQPSMGLAAVTSTKREPENTTNIQAEPTTNSLIITASPSMMTALNSIVAKLDIRPAQVLVEGVIVELNQDDLANFGIQWGALTTKETLAFPPGPGFQQYGEGVVSIIPNMQIQAILSMLRNINNVNILSTPSVVVLDNHKALLDIGQDVPTRTGEYATTQQGSVAPFNTFSYKKVTLTLEVIPQINLGNSVRLSVKLKNDSLQNPDNPGLNPLINTSEVRNSVIVNSCDVLVLGGLIRNTLTEGVDKIPLLSDIPIAGNLFKHKTRKLEKRNLVIFLKPIILHNEQDAMAITHTKYDLTRNAQIAWPEDLSNPGKQKRENILPLWNNGIILPKPFENA